MGKASSAKKVARVARSSGGPAREQAKFGFPLAVFMICVLGTLLVVWARDDRNSATAVPPQLTDHWHAAYGIYVCDTFLPGLTDVAEDTTGIHTHDDGIVHVHPFSNAATGEKATWSKFGEVAGITFDGTSFTLADGTTYSDGHDCNGQPAEVVMYQWPADDPDAEPTIWSSDLGDVRFSADRLAFTLAVVPEGTEVPRPESIPTLDNLSDDPNAAQNQTGGTTPPIDVVTGDTTPVATGEPSQASSTTATTAPPGTP